MTFSNRDGNIGQGESDMAKLRKHGQAPFRVAAVHGGPGAAGAMAPVAEVLSRTVGVLEPLQTADTIAGQVAELREALEEAGGPVVLVGHSWGAWLSWIVAAEHPEIVDELVLVGSGPFEERYAEGITATRLGRLDARDRQRALVLLNALGGPASSTTDEELSEFGSLMSKADSFDALRKGGRLPVSKDVFLKVSAEAAELRRSGWLLEIGKSIRCPVLAIHGDYDPHPLAGVKEPLSRTLRDFRFVLLEDCGHEPWNERKARDAFFNILVKELAAAGRT